MNIWKAYSKLVMMMKKGITALLLAILLMSSCLAFFFTRPAVCFVISSDYPEDYAKALSKPHRISFYYRTKTADPSSFDGRCDIAVVFPPSDIDKEDAVYVGKGEGRVFSIDEEKMFSRPLEGAGSDSFAFLYDSDDERASSVAAALKASYDRIVLVPYSGEINSVNLSSVKSEIERNSLSRVIVYSPASAMRFIADADERIYVDWRDAAALSGYRKVIAICPDWDRAVRDALASDSQDIPLHFALSVT